MVYGYDSENSVGRQRAEKSGSLESSLMTAGAMDIYIGLSSEQRWNVYNLTACRYRSLYEILWL